MVQLLHWKRAVFGSKRLHSRQGFATTTGFGGGGVGSLTGGGAGTGVAYKFSDSDQTEDPGGDRRGEVLTSFFPSSLAALAFFFRSGKGLISSPYGRY